MKRFFACLLSVMLIVLFIPMNAHAATSPSYSSIKVASVTQDNAVFTATINNPSKIKLTEGGFFIGTSSGNAINNGIKKTDKIASKWQTSKTLNCSYDFKNEYKISLKSNTQYYVVLYCKDSSNNYYYSSEQPFTTSQGVNYSEITIKSISTDTANITAKINNPSGVVLNKAGFGIGTQSGTCMINGSAVDTIAKKWQTIKTLSCSYDFKNEYGITLTENTKYYVMLYCTDSNGNNYYSNEFTFITNEAPKPAPQSGGGNQDNSTSNTETNIGPFISNADETLGNGNGGKYDGCFLNSMTMVLNALGKRNSDGNYLTPYDVAGEDTNSCPGFYSIEQKFNVKITGSDTLMPEFGNLSSTDQEAKLIEFLKNYPEGQRVLRVSFGFHCIAVVLNSNDQLVVYDPGFRSKKQAEGTNKWDGEGVTYSRTTGYWKTAATSFVLVQPN